MSAEENKQVCLRFVNEVINGGNLDAIDELFASNYVNHMAPPGLPTGPEGEKQFTMMFFSAFPDGKITVEDVLAEGEKVASRYIYSATHKGNFIGIPPTGKRFTVSGVNVFRVAGGKIVENWPSLDMLGIMQQIGVIPAPGA